MKFRSYIAIVTILVNAGCGAMTVKTEKPESNSQGLPPELISLVAPMQDVSTARLLRSDNCFWYEHRGQVETTLLPLTTAGGRPICMQSQS